MSLHDPLAFPTEAAAQIGASAAGQDSIGSSRISLESTTQKDSETPRHTASSSHNLSLQAPAAPTHQVGASMDSPLPSPLTAQAGSETSRRTKEKVAKRNIDFVIHGSYEIKTWYRSPYVLEDDETTSSSASTSNGATSTMHRSDSATRGRRGGRGGHHRGEPRRSALERVASATNGGGSPHTSAQAGYLSASAPATSGIGGALSNSAADAPALQASADHASMPASSLPASPTASSVSSEPMQIPTAGAADTAVASTLATAPAPSVMSTAPIASSALVNGAQQSDEPPVKNLWVCEGCFKYMRTYAGYAVHKKDCRYTHPPGRKAYQRGALIIWEVDGEKEKLYCQNLSLFGKLFIDHKTIYFDVEPFIFYVLTEATSQFDHVIGYFSKEKISYDDYNLACIITFPPYQKRNYGTLMIEFSYYLSSLTEVAGTPERPLSDLGFKGYVSFWSAVVLRTLALAYNDTAPDISPLLLPSTYNASATRHGGKLHAQNASNQQALAKERQRRACVRIRSILLGLATAHHDGPFATKRLFSSVDDGEEEAQRAKKARRASKGWAGEVPRMSSLSKLAAAGSSSSPSISIPLGKSHESTDKVERRTPDRTPAGESLMDTSPLSATSTTRETNGEVVRRATLEEEYIQQDARLDPDSDWTGYEFSQERLATATSMRTEDVAFALAELGLLRLRKKKDGEVSDKGSGGAGSTLGNQGPTIVISRETVRAAIRAKKLKVPILDETYILIDYRAEWKRQKAAAESS